MLLLFSGLGFYNSQQVRAGLGWEHRNYVVRFPSLILSWLSFWSEVPWELPSVLLEVKLRSDFQVLASGMSSQPQCLLWGRGWRAHSQLGQFIKGLSETWMGESPFPEHSETCVLFWLWVGNVFCKKTQCTCTCMCKYMSANIHACKWIKSLFILIMCSALC